MLKKVVLLTFLGLVVSCVSGWAQITPQYEFKTLDGKTVTAGDLRGQPLLIDFFGVPCPPCHKALPETNDLMSRFPYPARIIAVDAWYDSHEEIKGLWSELGLSLPVYTADRANMKVFEIDVVPTVVILDAEGVLVEKIAGYSEVNAERIEQILLSVAKPEVQPQSETEPEASEEPIKEPVEVAEQETSSEESAPSVPVTEESESGTQAKHPPAPAAEQAEQAEIKTETVRTEMVETRFIIHFERGELKIAAADATLIDKVYALVKDNPRASVKLVGHTDSVGDAETNLLLGEARGREVAAMLTARGFDKNRIEITSVGEAYPRGDNRTRFGRSQNRCVEVIVTSEASPADNGTKPPREKIK